MASFESPVKLDPSNPKNRVSLMEFGLTWLQKNTVIRDSKCRGGIVGITRKKAALIRWSLTRHVFAEFT